MGPTEAMKFANIDELTRCAIGLTCIKEHFAFEADRFHHEFAEFADGEFLASTHVDVAVADFSEARYSAATACAVVAVHGTVHASAVMHAGVLLDADDVAEVHVQQHMHRRVGHVLAPEELAKRLAGAPEGHLVVLDAVLGEDLQDFVLGGVTVDSLDRALVHIDLDARPVAIVNELGQIHLAHHGGHHVAVFQVEVVVGAIEVRGHHGDVVGAVLQVVTLAHLETRNLSDGVFLVGVFEFAREEGVLFHGLWGVLGVNAGRTQEQKLLHVVGVSLAEHVALDFHVHHHEVGTVERVCHDSADKCRREHHRIGPFFIKEFLYSVLVSKIEFLMGTANQIVVPTRFQVIPNGGAHQPMVARNVNL